METDQLRQVFLKFRNNEEQETITLDNARNALTELGKDANSEEFSEVFSQKYFKTGVVSFEDFAEVFNAIEKGSNPKIVGNKIKAKLYTSKFLAKVQKAITGKNNGDAGGVGAQEKNLTIDWNIQVGSNDHNTNFEVFSGIGVQRDNLVQQLSFAEIEDNQYYVLIRFRVADSEAAKQEFQDIIEQALAMADAMLPPEIQQYKETLQFNYYAPDSENLYIRISSNHELLEFVSQQVNFYNQMIQPDIKFDLKLQTSQSFQHLHNNKQQLVVDAFLGQENLGFNFSFNTTAGNNMIKTIHSLILQQLEELKEHSSYRLRKVGPPAFLFMLFQSLVFDFKLNNIGQLTQQLKSFIPDQTILDDALNNSPLSELSQAYASASSEIPIVQQVVEFFRNQGKANIGVYVVSPLAAVKVKVELPGLGDFLNPYFNQQQ